MASSFVDKARISIHAGKGGDGAVAALAGVDADARFIDKR